MKKQILILAMCLVLTSTSDLLSNASPVTTNAVSQTKATVVATKTVAELQSKEQIKSASVLNFIKPPEQPQMMTREEAKKRFEDKRIKERELLYTNLGLSVDQRRKAEELDAKTREEAGKFIKSIQAEAKKLRDLQAKHASFFAIYKQKLAFRSAKMKAAKFILASKKSFEAILTKEQKAKFKLINDAKKKEREQYKKQYKTDRLKGHFGPKSMGPPPSEIERPIGPLPSTTKNLK